MTNGRSKGARGEREVAELCRAWWARLEPTVQFVRTPMSGGWSNPAARAHFKTAGDVMTTSARWPFTVEVKWRRKWNVARLFDGQPTPVWAWWRQAQRDALTTGGVPMLWLRRDRLPTAGVGAAGRSFPWLVMVPSEYVVSAKLPEPDVAWRAADLKLAGVDFGALVPALYFYDRLTQVSPRRLALGEQGGSDADV